MPLQMTTYIYLFVSDGFFAHQTIDSKFGSTSFLWGPGYLVGGTHSEWLKDGERRKKKPAILREEFESNRGVDRDVASDTEANKRREDQDGVVGRRYTQEQAEHA